MDRFRKELFKNGVRPDFSEEQDFPESHLITADHVGKTGIPRSKLLQCGSRTQPWQASPNSELCWSSLTLPPKK
jgi:hypothetical protein